MVDRSVEIGEQMVVVSQRGQDADGAEELDMSLADPLDEHGDSAGLLVAVLVGLAVVAVRVRRSR